MMNFIELTLADVARRVSIRVDSIVSVESVQALENRSPEEANSIVRFGSFSYCFIETQEEVNRRIKEATEANSVPVFDFQQVIEERRKRIDSANVSEAAKAFYRKWYSNTYTSTGGWRDDYELIKELDEAGLVMTRLVFIDL